MSTDITWIVVADAARARIFTLSGVNADLEDVTTLTHPESEKHEGDLRTGGKGANVDSTGASLRQSDPQITTMEKHAEHFAKQIAQALRLGRDQDKYTQLIIAAAPRELGRIRDNLDSTTKKHLKKTIDKNWAQHDRLEIQKLLKEKVLSN